MPAVLSRLAVLAPYQNALPAVVGVGVFVAIMKLYKTSKVTTDSSARALASKKEKGEKAHVDRAFFQKLARIWAILVPKLLGPETLYMVLVAICLLCRTYADVWMIRTSTRIEATIIDRDRKNFLDTLMSYIYAMPVISLCNALLKFSLNNLKLRFRERLTKHLYEKYLNGFTFYKMSNLDNRIANADQLLTQDVDKFCEGIVELYSNLSKPLVDVVLYVSTLGSSLGWGAPTSLFVYLFICTVFLTRLRRPIGKMTVDEQALEGQFRFVNARLITNSEEIAFYKGNARERQTVFQSFGQLIGHLRKLVLFRFSIGFVDNIVAKYFATVVGWSTVSRPFFDETNAVYMAKTKNELIQDYYNSGRMMYRLAEALGRLSLAGREMTRLAGFTSRVDLIMNVLDDLNAGRYQRTQIQDNKEENQDDEDVAAKREQRKALLTATMSGKGKGQLVEADHVIRFEDVPLITPNGDVLIEKLQLEVRSGCNVLVCGPNGCGKSSLFRVLGGLWPLAGGKLTKPAAGKLFYVPQRPYMTLGTLRDQIIYPDRPIDMIRKGISDADLLDYLDKVQLSYLLAREGGWEAVSDWMDVLSGGEKQRVAMARLFYHRPQFAILDECTSAVSVDVEGAMYQLCRTAGITLFTVSHRKSLWVHHDYYLHMDGRGSYTFAKIDPDKPQFGS